jgi:hypothetical protein
LSAINDKEEPTIGKTAGVEGTVHVALDDVIAIVPAST